MSADTTAVEIEPATSANLSDFEKFAEAHLLEAELALKEATLLGNQGGIDTAQAHLDKLRTQIGDARGLYVYAHGGTGGEVTIQQNAAGEYATHSEYWDNVTKFDPSWSSEKTRMWLDNEAHLFHDTLTPHTDLRLTEQKADEGIVYAAKAAVGFAESGVRFVNETFFGAAQLAWNVSGMVVNAASGGRYAQQENDALFATYDAAVTQLSHPVANIVSPWYDRTISAYNRGDGYGYGKGIGDAAFAIGTTLEGGVGLARAGVKLGRGGIQVLASSLDAPPMGSWRTQIGAVGDVSRVRVTSSAAADSVATRYGSAAQRQTLLKLASATRSLSEAKGVVYATREMRRLGYELEDVSLHYRGNQGVDLVFSKNGQYAIVEAKHSQYLSSLQTYAGGLRQGSMDYNISRLERYLQHGDGVHNLFVNRLLDDVYVGQLESFVSLYRGRSTYELPMGWPVPSVPPVKR